MAKLILEQVANALRFNQAQVHSAAALGRAAVQDGAVVVALDEGDRQDVFGGAAEERARRGVTIEQASADGRVVACVTVIPGHVHGAAGFNPAAGWGAPIMVTPRTILAALDEAQGRIRQLDEKVAEQRRQLKAARLVEIERDEELRTIGAALDATGIPREDSDGSALTASQRARTAGICAGHGWRIGEVRIERAAGDRVRVTVAAPPPSPVDLLRSIKTRLVDLAREAVDAGAPPTVLGHLHAARQRIEEAALDIEDWKDGRARGDRLNIAIDPGSPGGDRTAVSLASVSESGLVTMTPVPPSDRFDPGTMQCRAHGVVGCTRCIAEDINAAMDARKQREGQAR